MRFLDTVCILNKEFFIYINKRRKIYNDIFTYVLIMNFIHFMDPPIQIKIK